MTKKRKVRSEEQRFKARRTQFLRMLRKAFNYSDTYIQAKEAAVSETTGPRGGKLSDCAICGQPSSRVEIDHIEPVVPLDMYQYEMSEIEAIESVFCLGKIGNVQAVCTSCHKDKSREENELRRRHKKARKLHGQWERKDYKEVGKQWILQG